MTQHVPNICWCTYCTVSNIYRLSVSFDVYSFSTAITLYFAGSKLLVYVNMIHIMVANQTHKLGAFLLCMLAAATINATRLSPGAVGSYWQSAVLLVSMLHLISRNFIFMTR